MTSYAQRIRAHHDLYNEVTAQAAGWDLSLTHVSVNHRDGITAEVHTYDDAVTLAKLFNLWRVDRRPHVHNGSEQLHTRWTGDGVLVVVNVSLVEAVGAVAS